MRARGACLVTVITALCLQVCMGGGAQGAAATSPEAERSLNSQLLWRVGQEDSAVLFGVIRDLKLDADGNVLVLDGQLHKVHVFSPQGALISSFGSAGEGPDDLASPVSVDRGTQGELVVFESRPPAIKRFRNDGVLLSVSDLRASLPPNAVLAKGCIAGERTYVSGYTFQYAEDSMKRTNWLGYLANSLGAMQLVFSDSSVMDLAKPVIKERDQRTFATRWAASAAGGVAVSLEFSKPEVVIQGRELTRVTLPVDAVARSDADREATRSGFRSPTDGSDRLQIDVERVSEAVPSILAAPTGEFWCWLGIPAAEAQGGKCTARFAVVSQDGNLARLVDVLGEEEGAGELFAVGKNTIVVARGVFAAARANRGIEGTGEDLDLVIEYYRLVRP